MIKNIQTILNFSKKKNQIFWERSRSRVPKHSLTTRHNSLFLFEFVYMYIVSHPVLKKNQTVHINLFKKYIYYCNSNCFLKYFLFENTLR